MGTFTAVTDLGVGIGAAMMGLILNWTSYPTMFLCLALVGFINLPYFHFFIRKKEGIDMTIYEYRCDECGKVSEFLWTAWMRQWKRKWWPLRNQREKEEGWRIEVFIDLQDTLRYILRNEIHGGVLCR